MITRPLTIKCDFLTRFPMSKQTVNLDALIQREDLEIVADNAQQSRRSPQPEDTKIKLDELRSDARLYRVMRKPDFQRETSNWTPEAIVDLVKSQVDGELIPAIILWNSPSNEVFVIDGAHRLSALIGWVNDDYGDREISHAFFGTEIPRVQEEIAAKTRALMEKTVRSFKFLSSLYDKPTAGTEEERRRCNALALNSIKTQWVTGDARRAEDSFVRINQGGAVIDETEKEIIAARTKPEGLAARALLRAGTGHQYWWKCSEEVRKQIVYLAGEIYRILYKPEENTEGYNSVPIAGKSFSSETLQFLFEIIHVANDLKREPSKKKKKEILKNEDPKVAVDMEEMGRKAVSYLESILDLAETIFSKKNCSLGLHPAVYCRSATGKFQPAAYLAQILLIKHLREEHDGFHTFTKFRERFENFLVKYKYFINQLVRGLGAGTRSLGRLAKMYIKVYDGMKSGMSDEEVKTALLLDPELSNYISEILPNTPNKRGDFSSEAKAAVKLRTELETAKPCPECRARLHVLASQTDHDVRNFDGGSSHSNNGQLMHPFCNTGVKERRVHLAKQAVQQT